MKLTKKEKLDLGWIIRDFHRAQKRQESDMLEADRLDDRRCTDLLQRFPALIRRTFPDSFPIGNKSLPRP